jgi:hypothetical protein
MTGSDANALLARLVAQLEGDVLFTMSLGSKELFHSNLLGWYLRRFPGVRAALLDAWEVPAQPADADAHVCVLRESQHFDLMVHEPGRRVLVIENKVFALPDTAQLEEYEKQAPRGAALVLLSLTDPGWEEYRGWRYRSYGDLRSVLLPLVPDIAAVDGYAGLSLARWLTLIGSLVELYRIAGHPGPGEPLMPSPAVRQLLAPARLDVPVQKMRFQHAARELARELEPELSAGKLTVRADVTRATGLVEAFTAGYPRLGWQLQGDAFRLCAEPHPRLAPGPRGSWDKIEGQARRYARYFDFAPLYGIVPEAGPVVPADGDGSPAFRHFRPSFVYQYVRVPGVTAEQVREIGLLYARSALEARQ